jgi:chemotaxis protein MotA
VSTLLGLIGISFSIYFALTHEGGGFTGFLQPAGMVLVGLGPPSIMLLSHGIGDFVTGVKLLLSSMLSRLQRQQDEVIDTLTNCSKLVRSDGIGAIIPLRDQAKYALLRDGLSLIVNDFKPEEIRHNLMARVNAKQMHLQLASNLFENMSKVSPAVGMIGTLMGLINMLSNMQDPAKIGSNMALAMITTLYGLMLGTILYAPWGEKIALEAEKTLEVDMLVVEGILNIKGKKSSVHLKDLVKTYGTAKGKADAAPPAASIARKGA